MMTIDLGDILLFWGLLIALIFDSFLRARREVKLDSKINFIMQALKGVASLPCPLEPGEEKTFSITISREKTND
jgi:hypothetical protein